MKYSLVLVHLLSATALHVEHICHTVHTDQTSQTDSIKLIKYLGQTVGIKLISDQSTYQIVNCIHIRRQKQTDQLSGPDCILHTF